ncbi:dihydrolipoyl dehydrogenase family protein [Tianweitania sediminis]|uniref:FAD-dependent oxidoreductase n=1 Tax=Tianweitania sediminis TaxID=1502156 RepID=A0A8J7R620_9HYPH|nr:FAD-dependent oxidoreductase [Tianweitania sediminis]MBP0438507.1 FAD-dependent oxidoreductase [Tianweitania sediminis]
MTKLLQPDLCVIGAGSGGLSVVAAARAFGVSVVLIEKGKMGGDCLNYGCVPSKSLLAAARRAHEMRNATPFGLQSVDPVIDFAAVRRHVRGVIDSIAPIDSEERFRDLGAQVIRAHARFFGKDTLEAGGFTIKARRIVVATGSSPVIPPIPGIDTVEVLTNETIFDVAELPRHLAILGGGPVGVELAQAFRRLGAQVTVLDRGRILKKEDADLADVTLASFRRDGVDLRPNTTLSRVEKHPGGLRLHLASAGKPSTLEASQSTLEASHLLVAAGRRPNVTDLGLEAAGVEFNEQGIKVDNSLRSVSNSLIYAVGDVAGGAQFTHAANYHAGLVLRPILFRAPAKVRPEIIPRVTYTDPEIAAVGATEEEARMLPGKHRVLRWQIADNDRARAEHETEGFIKVIAGTGGKILGVAIVGRNAGELIHIWALAIAQNLSLKDMTSYVAPYPTVGEIGKRVSVSYFEAMTRKPIVRGLLGGLRLFG